MHRTAGLFALLGIAAAVVPWALRALDVTEAGVHDGLWFAAVPFGVAWLASLSGSGRRVMFIMGALALAAAAIELPGVWSNVSADADGAVAELLRGYAVRHLVCYGVVVVAGLGLVVIGLRARVHD